MSILEIPDRNFSRPFLSLQETNQILRYLRETYRAFFRNSLEESPPIIIRFEHDFPPYSIFTIETGPDFRWEVADAKAKVVIAPSSIPTGKGQIFVTNGGQNITNGMSLGCEIIGNHKPHLIKYSSTAPEVGDLLQPSAGNEYVVKDNSGQLVAVSEANTTDQLIWLTAYPSSTSSGTPPPSDPRLGYATLAQNMCNADTTAVSISSPKYYDGTAISALTAVNNPLHHQGKNGDKVIIHLIDWGTGPEWTVVDVNLHVRSVMYDIAFGYTQGDPDTCSIIKGLHDIAAEDCSDPSYDTDDYLLGIQLWIHELPYTYELESRAVENSVRDSTQDPCIIKAKTKKFCLFQQTPEDGDDKTVVEFTPKTFLKEIYEDTICVASQVVPVIAASIQTVYIPCFDTPIEEVQIEGVPCPGEETSC